MFSFFLFSTADADDVDIDPATPQELIIDLDSVTDMKK